MSDFEIAVKSYDDWVEKNPTISKAVAAVQALTSVIDHNDFKAGSECIRTLKDTIKYLSELHKESIALGIACNIFFRYVSRVDWTLDSDSFNKEVRDRAHRFCASVSHCRDLIFSSFETFIRDDQNILVHGNSVVVASALIKAAQSGKQFNVYVTEGRPACDGYIIADRLRAAGIPTTLIVDTAVGYVLAKMDMVLCGAEAIDENGGVVNRAGTYQIAMSCHALNKPFYVLCESYKFLRQLLFSQDDLSKLVPPSEPLQLFPSPQAESVATLPHISPVWDYTHPQFVTLLFTDLGALAPSAVSDELFKLYY